MRLKSLIGFSNSVNLFNARFFLVFPQTFTAKCHKTPDVDPFAFLQYLLQFKKEMINFLKINCALTG